MVVVGGAERHKPLSSTIETSVKFRNLPSYIFTCWRRITFKVASLLILRRFFQWCRRCFPNWSMSKVKNRGSSKAKNGILFDWKQLPIIFERFYLHVLWVHVYFFCILLTITIETRKKSTKEQKTTTATPVLKFTSCCCHLFDKLQTRWVWVR